MTRQREKEAVETQALRKDLARRALDAPRLTLGELAERLGVSKAALEKYREGKARMPPAVRLRLAAVLEAHAAELEATVGALREAVAATS